MPSRTVPRDEAGGAWSTAEQAPPEMPSTRRLWRRVRVVRRGLVVVGWTAAAGVVQSALLVLPGHGKTWFARFYWAVNCRVVGCGVRVIGAPATDQGRPVVYASNHSSWLDVPVLGGHLLGCFVAKDDVGRWPLVGQVARLGRTIFVSRQRGTTGRERDEMRRRLASGDNLILFPEGTSSDGSGVLPFHSSFFAAAKPSNGQACEGSGATACMPLVQPVSIVYDRLAGLPVGSARRAVFAWYGDMDLASHFWQLAQWRSMRASVWLHPPLDPADFPTRKSLAEASWRAVAQGAAQLRQNRLVAIDAPGKATKANKAGGNKAVGITAYGGRAPSPTFVDAGQSPLDKHSHSFA